MWSFSEKVGLIVSESTVEVIDPFQKEVNFYAVMVS